MAYAAKTNWKANDEMPAVHLNDLETALSDVTTLAESVSEELDGLASQSALDALAARVTALEATGK